MREMNQEQGRAPSWRRLHDMVLLDEMAELLAHDRRINGLNLSMIVDGGVAHVEGEVGSEEERQLLRRLLRQKGGLFAVWDLLSVKGQRLLVADIGCGRQKQVPWAIGVDRCAGPETGIVADLEVSVPFKHGTMDHVFAIHILEHIRDLVGLMNEIHRVLRPTGVLHVMTPYWRSVIAVADPTHLRLMDQQTFKYFCQPPSGTLPWRPLMLATSEDSVLADLQPLKDGSQATRSEIARWFY